MRLLWVGRPLVLLACSLRLALLFFVLLSICPPIRLVLCAVCVRSSLAAIRPACVASRFGRLWCACPACVFLPPLLFPPMASPFRGGRHRRYNRTMYFINIFVTMKYFTFRELLRSETAIKNGIANVSFLYVEHEAYMNLKALVEKLLDPIREKFATPMIITSGYRCKQLNELVKGVEESQHREGKAADFYFAGFTAKEMAQAFLEIADGFDFDQLIYYKNRHFIHISYNGDRNRHQALIK